MSGNNHLPWDEQFLFSTRNQLAAVHQVQQLAVRPDAEPVADLEAVVPARGCDLPGAEQLLIISSQGL